MPSLSVLVPAYQEEATIESVLRRLLGLGDLLLEVVVVDDGSTDATSAVAREVAREDPRVRVLVQEPNQGKTAAVRRAVREARGDVLVVQDADLEYDPAEIPRLVRPILEDEADVVYGSRFRKGRATRTFGARSWVANRVLTFVSNLLTGRTWSDVETCYKAFRACVIKPLPLTSRGFGMEVEITALVSRTRVRHREVPVSYRGRTYAEGKKIGVRDGLAALWYILRFNLGAHLRPATRRYVRGVNAALAARRLALDAAWRAGGSAGP